MKTIREGQNNIKHITRMHQCAGFYVSSPPPPSHLMAHLREKFDSAGYTHVSTFHMLYSWICTHEICSVVSGFVRAISKIVWPNENQNLQLCPVCVPCPSHHMPTSVGNVRYSTIAIALKENPVTLYKTAENVESAVPYHVQSSPPTPHPECKEGLTVNF